MITKSSISANLDHLDRLYNSATNPQESLFYAKLAMLELCGWIEESMDSLILACARRNVKVPSNISYVEKSVVRRTHGFDYDQHFRSMLIGVIGIVHVERIERDLDPAIFTKFKAALGRLKSSRDPQAHTHLHGAMITLDAPSTSKTNLAEVYAGLMQIERCVRYLSF